MKITFANVAAHTCQWHSFVQGAGFGIGKLVRISRSKKLKRPTEAGLLNLAEEEGFEPSLELSPH